MPSWQSTRKPKWKKRNNHHQPEQKTPTRTAQLTSAERLKRAFEFDIAVYPLCGGTLRVIADITEPELINKILNHVGTQLPRFVT